MLMTKKKIEEKLEQVTCIWYFIIFKDQIETLLNLQDKVNTMSQVFAYQLSFKTWKTSVWTQKIDNTTLKTYRIVIYIFSIWNRDGKERFFKESFLMANIKLDVMLKILFLITSNANIDFQVQNL